jgi:hypothetical protein
VWTIGGPPLRSGSLQDSHIPGYSNGATWTYSGRQYDVSVLPGTDFNSYQNNNFARPGGDWRYDVVVSATDIPAPNGSALIIASWREYTVGGPSTPYVNIDIYFLGNLIGPFLRVSMDSAMSVDIGYGLLTGTISVVHIGIDTFVYYNAGLIATWNNFGSVPNGLPVNFNRAQIDMGINSYSSRWAPGNSVTIASSSITV